MAISSLLSSISGLLKKKPVWYGGLATGVVGLFFFVDGFIVILKFSTEVAMPGLRCDFRSMPGNSLFCLPDIFRAALPCSGSRTRGGYAENFRAFAYLFRR